MSKTPPKLKVGTDCSGMEAPIQALKNLRIPFSHEFSCDIDPHCEKTIRANYTPKRFYHDITQRNNKTTPYVDLYVCGFPCQPFSSAGKRRGTYDLRGTIVYHCIDYIRTQKPLFFILENVKGLLSIDKGKFFEFLLGTLRRIRGYQVDYVVLNTKDFGIPQNRERVFIVGSRIQQLCGFPPLELSSVFDYRKPLKPLTSYVDRTDRTKNVLNPRVEKELAQRNFPKHSVFINLNFLSISGNYPNSDRYTPCITANATLWCLPLHRKANVKEYLRLQGFPVNFKQVVSDRQMKKQIGNSISVCVLEALFKTLFYYK